MNANPLIYYAIDDKPLPLRVMTAGKRSANVT